MRYLQIPIIAFTDVNGVQRSVRDIRPLPSYTIARTMNKNGEDDFDEIASRQYVYGDDGERNAYKIHEANIVAILDARFDYSLLKTIVVPQ